MRLVKKQEGFIKENVISNPNIFERKNTQIAEDGVIVERRSFAEDGLFSPKIFGSLDTLIDFSCDCGKYQGKIYEGITCEECNTEVKNQEANIDKAGWINLNGNYLIKYLPYQFLEKLIGKENLANIIYIPSQITVNGDVDTDAIEEIRNSSPAKKYWHIGLNEFYRNYSVILDYYFELNHVSDYDLKEKSKKRKETGKPIESEKSAKDREMYHFVEYVCDVFTDKIYVLPVSLRPAMRTAEGLKLDELNVVYTNILKNAQTLNDSTETLPLIKEITLEILQSQYFQLSEMIIDNIKSKAGLIRSQICGTRVNFSSRNIITPAGVGIKLDEVVLPYQTFLELNKYEIINLLCKLTGCSLVAAERKHFQAMIEFDEEIYNLCLKVIKETEVGILLNRNPSIAYGSILYLRVADIKRDITDLTTSVNNTYIGLMGGDYDESRLLNLII